jgi:hypothetical protein
MMIHAGREALVEQLGDYERFKGHVGRSEPLSEDIQWLQRRAEEFLQEWEKDAVLALALYSIPHPEYLQADHFYSLLQTGHIWENELDRAFVGLLDRWLSLESPTPDNPSPKYDNSWLSIRKRAHELSVMKNEVGWYVLPKTRRWIEKNELDYQPILFAALEPAA